MEREEGRLDVWACEDDKEGRTTVVSILMTILS